VCSPSLVPDPALAGHFGELVVKLELPSFPHHTHKPWPARLRGPRHSPRAAAERADGAAGQVPSASELLLEQQLAGLHYGGGGAPPASATSTFRPLSPLARELSNAPRPASTASHFFPVISDSAVPSIATGSAPMTPRAPSQKGARMRNSPRETATPTRGRRMAGVSVDLA
jgi:hypothetical protein